MLMISAGLAGHMFDLELLASLFSEGDPVVVRRGDDFSIESCKLEGLEDDGLAGLLGG